MGALTNLDAPKAQFYEFRLVQYSTRIFVYKYGHKKDKLYEYKEAEQQRERERDEMNWDGGIFRKVRQSLAVTWPIEWEERGRGHCRT